MNNTKKTTVIRLCLALLALSITPEISAQEWNLVWSEEFNKDGQPDTAVWNYEHGFTRNNEAQWYQPDNAYCKDGKLIIEARKEKRGRKNPLYEKGSTNWRKERKYIEYTATSMTTAGKKEFLYGRFEVRAKIPTAGGAWPAIWLLGRGLGWPNSGEIDMMEYYRIQGVPHILANTCWGAARPGAQTWDTMAIPFTHWTDRDPNWADKFHIWRMDWNKDYIRLYLDDELLNETPLSETINGRPGKGINPFHRPQYLLLNLAIGGNNGGPIDDKALPMKYEVDYVRVYQQAPTQAPTNDIDGNYINAHGGGILSHEGTYYWFGEHRPDKGFSTQVGVNCYSSKNLKDWKHEGIALQVSEEEGNPIERGCIIERPKVIYNAKTKKFVMWFHLELKGQGYGPAQAGVAVSDKVEGPYKMVHNGRVNPGIFPMNMTEEEQKASWVGEEYEKWWTPIWRKGIEGGMLTQRDVEGGQMSRDMTLFVDTDGRAYHIYSSEENLTLQIAELTDDYLAHSGRYIRLAPGGHNEAPAIFRKDNTYWLIASGCTGWAPNAARLFSAPSIWGPWKQHPNPCRGEGADKTFGGQSTYVLSLPNGEYLFMADIWKPQSLMYSGHLWIPIRFAENGVPYLEKQ